MNILIAGSSGFIGRKLFNHLTTKGHLVKTLVRRKPNKDFEIHWNPDKFAVPQDAIQSADVIINLCGRNISDWLWTPRFKQELYESRIKPTRSLALSIAKLPEKKLTFISTSGVGIYGAQHPSTAREESPIGSGFFPELAQSWEKEALAAQSNNHRVAVLRLAVVLGKEGGLIKKIAPTFKLGLGAKIGSGRNWISWVAADDLCGAFDHIIETENLSGPINVVNPNAYLADDFYNELGKAFGRLVIIRLPSFLIQLVLGELGEETILASQRVAPKKLLESDFKFLVNQPKAALVNVC